MKTVLVIGGQWGDEGKGKLVDHYSDKASICARYNGGTNAGHTVIAPNGTRIALHILPCGSLDAYVVNYLGPGVVLHVKSLFDEMDEVHRVCGHIPRVVVNERATLVFDFLMEVDAWMEVRAARREGEGATVLGTTRKAIGPSYASRCLRIALQVKDLTSESFEVFEQKYLNLLDFWKVACMPEGLNSYDHVSELKYFKEIKAQLTVLSHPGDIKAIQNELVDKKDVREYDLLVEGANSVMLDLGMGGYPFVTSSHTGFGGVLVGLDGLKPSNLDEVIMVIKGYCTRVGEGPFPTEMIDDAGRMDAERGTIIQDVGMEYGATTKRPRKVGWLDLPMLRYTANANGCTAWCVNKLDVMGYIDGLKVCVDYTFNDDNKEDDASPTQPSSQVSDSPLSSSSPKSRRENSAMWPGFLRGAKPVFVQMEGWTPESVIAAKTYEELPDAVKDYVKLIETATNIPVKFIGNGAKREDLILKQ